MLKKGLVYQAVALRRFEGEHDFIKRRCSRGRDSKFNFFFLEEESRSLLRRNVSLKLPSSNLLLLNERPPSQSSSAISDVTSRTRFQASSGNSGSEDWPGYEAA